MKWTQEEIKKMIKEYRNAKENKIYYNSIADLMEQQLNELKITIQCYDDLNEITNFEFDERKKLKQENEALREACEDAKDTLEYCLSYLGNKCLSVEGDIEESLDKINQALTEQGKEEDNCICHEINSRHCGVHQNADEVCEWTLTVHMTYSECGHRILTEDRYMDMDYCPWCGKPIKEV